MAQNRGASTERRYNFHGALCREILSWALLAARWVVIVALA